MAKNADGTTEFTNDFDLDGNATSPVTARYADGELRKINEVTVADLVGKTTAKHEMKHRRRGKVYWEGVHKPSGEPLVIRARPDREMLTALMQKTVLICMVKTALFADGHEAAAKFLTPIATQWADGTLLKKNIYKLRNKMLADQKIGASRAQPARKRPASAPSPSRAVASPSAPPSIDDEGAPDAQPAPQPSPLASTSRKRPCAELRVSSPSESETEAAVDAPDPSRVIPFFRDAGLFPASPSL